MLLLSIAWSSRGSASFQGFAPPEQQLCRYTAMDTHWLIVKHMAKFWIRVFMIYHFLCYAKCNVFEKTQNQIYLKLLYRSVNTRFNNSSMSLVQFCANNAVNNIANSMWVFPKKHSPVITGDHDRRKLGTSNLSERWPKIQPAASKECQAEDVSS